MKKMGLMLTVLGLLAVSCSRNEADPNPTETEEKYEWVTLTEDYIGPTTSGKDKTNVLVEKKYIKKIRIDVSVSTLGKTGNYVGVNFFSDDGCFFLAAFNQYTKSIKYAYIGENDDAVSYFNEHSATGTLKSETVGENIIEFDFSSMADNIRILCYQVNVNLSGIQVYTNTGTT